jgi:hypothetical protein
MLSELLTEALFCAFCFWTSWWWIRWTLVYPELTNGVNLKVQRKQSWNSCWHTRFIISEIRRNVKEAKIDELMSSLGNSIKFRRSCKSNFTYSRSISATKNTAKNCLWQLQMESLNSLYKVQLESSMLKQIKKLLKTQENWNKCNQWLQTSFIEQCIWWYFLQWVTKDNQIISFEL